LPDQNQALALHAQGERSSFVRSTRYTRHLIGKMQVIRPKATLTEDNEAALKELGEALESEDIAR
jgi:hypothetical protein